MTRNPVAKAVRHIRRNIMPMKSRTLKAARRDAEAEMVAAVEAQDTDCDNCCDLSWRKK